MIDSCKNITEIQNDRNKIDLLILIFFVIHDGLVPIVDADVFATHGDKASAVIIGIEQA